ncbi:MAG: hypothetical protein ACXVDD_02870 [Polyangia bacterium]
MRPLLLAAVVLVGHVAWADVPPVRQAHVATLQSRLLLDASTAERMQSLVDKYNAKIAPLQRADVAILGELRTQLALTVPDARRLKSLSGDLVKNRQKLQSLRDERLRELQRTLTPAEFSRLLVRWPALTRQLRREARRARRS